MAQTIIDVHCGFGATRFRPAVERRCRDSSRRTKARHHADVFGVAACPTLRFADRKRRAFRRPAARLSRR